VGFLNDMLVAAGGENVFADVARESLPLTSEAILTAAPDVIVELTYDNRMTSDNQKEEIAVWNRLTSIPAVRQQRVYLMLGNQFVQPGPRLAEATTAIAQLLHPDVF
jgi:iron complex transport system substrate-binding protein